LIAFWVWELMIRMILVLFGYPPPCVGGRGGCHYPKGPLWLQNKDWLMMGLGYLDNVNLKINVSGLSKLIFMKHSLNIY